MICARTRSSASASKRGCDRARRNRSNDCVPVGGQHLHIAEHHVAAGVEVDAHGERLQALLEGDGVELASALVHHAGDEIGEALLVLRVLGGAAAEGKAHGDQGIGVALDQPSLDAAGAHDALDVHGVSRRCGKRREEGK